MIFTGRKLTLSSITKYETFPFTDLIKLYNHPQLDPDAGPQQLQNKVQLDIRYYFCRRGGENVHAFMKDTFELVFDTESKIAYVKKSKDELTKNHRESDNNMVTGFMPQILDISGCPHRLCPVRSFEIYINQLNPKIENLWQHPAKQVKPGATILFRAVPLGHNPLDTFMSKLSELCNLSQHYTNHCIRVTGVTHLIRTGKFTPKQVMAVSGHKSIHSLAIYERVAANEKMMMGMSLTYSLLNPEEVYQLKIAQMMKEHQQNQPNAIQGPMPQALPPPASLQPFAVPHAPNLPAIVPAQVDQNNLPLHALDPANNNILPLDNALVPYDGNPKQPNAPVPTNEDVDYLELLCADMNDDDENQALTLAAEQIEQQMSLNTTTSTKCTTNTALMKKAPVTTFTGCTFGNIGTLNIHIHKH